MAPGARALRKTASISRVGRSARGKAVSHGVFSGSWVREEQRRGCCGTGGRLLSCSHPTGHIPKVTGMGYQKLGWLGQGRLSLGYTQTLQSPRWDPPDLSGCGPASVQDLFPPLPFCIKFQTFSQDPRCASVSPSAGWEHNTAVTQERPEGGSGHQTQAAEWGQEHIMPCWKIAINILAVPKAGSLLFLISNVLPAYCLCSSPRLLCPANCRHPQSWCFLDKLLGKASPWQSKNPPSPVARSSLGLGCGSLLRSAERTGPMAISAPAPPQPHAV